MNFPDVDSNEPVYRRLLPYAILFLVPLALYLKSIGFDFIESWDDANYIVDNPVVHALSRENLAAMFGTDIMSNYAPLHLLSYALEYRLWGAGPAGYHAVNIVVHALNACLAYRLLREMTRDGRIAFWAALLFAVHPVNVESVAWVSESKTLFATFFSFLAIICYLWYVRTGRGSSLFLAALSFLAGTLFKASIVPLPLILLAYHAFILRDRFAWKPLVPFVVISVLITVLTVLAQSRAGAVDRQELTADVLLGLIYPTMLPVYWKYLGTFLAPISLGGLYDTTLHHSFLDPLVLLSLVGIIALLGLVLWKGNGQVRFWTLWFCLSLLPMANIIPIPVYYADRYSYRPMIGLSVLLVMGVQWGITALRRSDQTQRAVLAALVLTYGILAFQRLDVWRDDLVFWEDTAKKSPNIYKTRLNLGISYEMNGRLEEAEREYLASLSLHPTDDARYALGMVRAKLEYARQQRTPRK